MGKILVELLFKPKEDKLLWILSLQKGNHRKEFRGISTTKAELFDPVKTLFRALKNQVFLQIKTNKKFAREVITLSEDAKEYGMNYIDIEVIEELEGDFSGMEVELSVLPENTEDLPQYMKVLSADFQGKPLEQKYVEVITKLFLSYTYFKEKEGGSFDIPIFEQARKSGLFPAEYVIEDVFVGIEDALEFARQNQEKGV